MSHENHILKLEKSVVTLPKEHIWHNLPMFAGILGGGSLLVSVFMGMSDTKQFFFSYLVAFMFYLSLCLGAFFFVLIQHASRAGWSVVIRRLAENVMDCIPLFAILFIPLLFGMHDLFHWTHESEVAKDALLIWKKPFLNTPFFLIRAIFYIAIWTFMGRWFIRKSIAQDETGDEALTRKMQKWSGPAIMVLAFTSSFAAIDWMMTLDPHWYSTILGVYFFSGSLVGIFAFLTLFAMGMQKAGLLRDIITVEHYHDLGKLLFAFVVFWTYIAFSQYFLIWYANIPEETIWFAHRMVGSWKGVSISLAVGHFVIPFFFLMPRTIKRNKTALMLGAIWMLAIHFIDIYWLIMPVLHHHGVHFSMMDVVLFIALGGLFVARISWKIKQHALIPIKDPRLAESLSFENV